MVANCNSKAMKKIVILCLMMALVSCSTHKVSTERTDYKRLASELRELISSYEKRTDIYKDSLALMKGLVEKSSNVTDSTSHLETSYALSDASIRNGKLFHSLENKDSVPGRIIYVSKEVEKRDTIYRNEKDTVYIEKQRKEETVKEKKRIGDAFFYTSGLLAWGIVAIGAGIWFRYKVKKGER